jgi:hypothetical protein
MLTSLDCVGSLGALIAAVAAPCCFPLFAVVAATLGLGALAPYEAIILYTFQGFALLSLVGLAFAFRRHRRVGPLVVGGISVAILAYAFYHAFYPFILYAGLFGLLAATLWNYVCSCRHIPRAAVLRSVISCPRCGHRAEEIMPTNACLYFYDCPGCHARLKPTPGDCCVFCSYGSVPCPPIQLGISCCA